MENERWFCVRDLSTLIKRGSAPAYVEDGGILVLNQKCIRDQRINVSLGRRTDPTKKKVHQERLLQEFDVLVNSTGVGTLGRVAQVMGLSETATVDSHITIVRANPDLVDPHYLGLCLRALQADIESMAEGSTG